MQYAQECGDLQMDKLTGCCTVTEEITMMAVVNTFQKIVHEAAAGEMLW